MISEKSDGKKDDFYLPLFFFPLPEGGIVVRGREGRAKETGGTSV